MLFESDNVHKCVFCNNNNFYKRDGFFFCSSCQTQNENIIEEIFEERFDTTTRLRKTKIKSIKPIKTDNIRWTSWELYNFVILGLTNQLIEIGADSKVKLTVLQLWTQYLSKLDVAFISKNKKNIPKLAERYHKNDAKIIYGNIEQKAKKKQKHLSKRTSSMVSNCRNNEKISTRELNKSKKLLVTLEYEKFIQNQTVSDTNENNLLNNSLQSFRLRFNKKAKLEVRRRKMMSKKFFCKKNCNYYKKHITTQYATGPYIVTPLKLLSIICLALRINNSNIYISDILRFNKEGHLSYYSLYHLIPSEIILTKESIDFLKKTTDITHKGIRRSAASIAKLLNAYELANPDFINLIKRFCEDLQLPRGVFLYTQKIFMSSPSIMMFTSKSALIPNYEGRAMAYIIVVLKILFSLDDFTEIEISRIAENINRIGSKKEIMTSRLFNFCEWQRYIECRKTILTKLHFPSTKKYNPESFGFSNLYLRFMNSITSKKEIKVAESTTYKYFISQKLTCAFNGYINKLNNNLTPIQQMERFSPTFTPLQSYINQLRENSNYEIPNILKINFFEAKVGYITKPNSLIELATQCDMKLKIVDNSIQYIEKIVPLFEQTRISALEELNKLIKVRAYQKLPKSIINKSEILLDYSHKNRACKLKVNFENLKAYFLVYNKLFKFKETLIFKENSFFNHILFNGQLNINNYNFKDKKISNKPKRIEIFYKDKTCLINEEFSIKYNIKLYNHEIKSLLNTKKIFKKKYTPCQDAAGKFIKLSDRIKKKNIKINWKKEITSDFHDYFFNLNKVDSILKNHFIENKDVLISSSINKSINIEDLYNSVINDCDTLFRPYKNYWIYHCIFSRVKGKNFELLEKELPENFTWLLNECANIIEMTTEDLYEEVCIIECYYFNIFKSQKCQNHSDYNFYDYKTKKFLNNILKKW